MSTDALQRTIRRCTAVIVLAIGIHLTTVTRSGNDWGFLMTVVAGIYLFTSVVDPGEDTSAADSDDGAGSDHGADSDDGAGSDERGDGAESGGRSDAGG
ncbi:hypothetical protein [Halosimplex salinum]|uniref:hypothetical protein n=1 Tax=Halosimplex salinum TaxID=1710538 RepID=UPI000F472ABF|nr:hypothetical protein [Halosimplex salinum]